MGAYFITNNRKCLPEVVAMMAAKGLVEHRAYVCGEATILSFDKMLVARYDNCHRDGEDFILGQYTPGLVGDQDVPGYREESQVKPDSLTPTFAALRVLVDNWRWQGVPFYLVSGKRLGAKLTQIVIQFKEVPHTLFRSTQLGEIAANRLILGIYHLFGS